MGLLNLDGKPLVLTKSGSGGGTGYKVSFPTTMTEFGKANVFTLLLANGTERPIAAYSTIAGRIIDGVIGIRCIATNSYYVLKMTIDNGSIAQCYPMAVEPAPSDFTITTGPGTTPTWYNRGTITFWWPLADTVISAIEMYNTD